MRDDVAMPQRSLRVRLIAGSVRDGRRRGPDRRSGLGGAPIALLGAGAALVFLGVALLAPVISRPVVRVLGAAYPSCSARRAGWPGRTPCATRAVRPRRRPR